MLHLQNGAQIAGVRGATRLVQRRRVDFPGEAPTTSPLPNHAGWRRDSAAEAARPRALPRGRDIRIVDCEITGSGGSGIWLENIAGEVRGISSPSHRNTAIVSFDAQGLLVSRNTIAGTNDNGIEILRTAIGDDGTMVLRQPDRGIKAGPGGSGQYGNAINAFRAGNVIVRGNRIRLRLFRGARQFGIQHPNHWQQRQRRPRGRAVFRILFEGAVIANNTVDGAAFGVSVCNFNEGGRLAVVQGNIIRNLLPKRPIGTAPDDDAGVGIYVEADTSVSGNVIENAPSFGIITGWGKYLRDVAISGNVIRNAFVGIGVSVAPGAGTVLVGNNLISEAPGGAVVGLDADATGDPGSIGRWRPTFCAAGDNSECGEKINRYSALRSSGYRSVHCGNVQRQLRATVERRYARFRAEGASSDDI